MRAQGSTAILADEKRGKGPIDGALASSIRRCLSDLLILILLGTVLLGSLCIAASAADYYSGQKYRFGTVYGPNWDYLWDASCCSDNTKPCCFDPAKARESTFEITAPIVDQPTEITISVIVRTKRMASCMDMAELKITVKPLKGLTVVKKHLGGDGTFPFTGTGFSGDCGMSSFSLSPSNGYAFACPDLAPGTYTITEFVPPGWDLDGITVAGTDPANYRIADNTVTIMLQPNEAPVITFTDKKRCSLTVAKKAVGGDAAFSFTGEGFPSGCALESFQLKNGESASDQSLISGRAYTISEEALGGWDLESITVAGTDPANCQITGRSITITPQPGESPTVTFTSAKRGSILVDKVASPGGSVQEFEFKPSYGEPFKLSDASDPKDSGPLLPGTYSIIETAVPNWDLTDITVKGIASEPVVDLVTGTISFYLASGETARVTYTNGKKQADISGYVWDDANGNCILDKDEEKLSGWTVTLKDASGKVIAADTTDENGYYEFENVAPGKYNLQTTLQPGWAPTCPPEGKVEVDRTSIPIVQNFGVQRVGSITVIKDAIPNSRQPFEFTGTPGKFELIDDGTSSNRIVFTSLIAGDYEIKEQVPAGWSLISVDCTGCPSDPIEDGVVVHLNEGGSATVRFVDISAVGGLSLNKSTQNKTVALGQDILYTITLCNDGPVSLTNVTLWDALPESVELVDVYPEPASYCHWTIGTLAPGQCFVVDLRARIKKIDINYDMAQRVQGEGFVNVHNDYDTSIGPESVKNCAYAKADFVETISSCAHTNIKNPGTELMRREFGSGTYESEELSAVRTENKSIKSTTSLSATHSPTTFSLPKGRSIEYGSKWTEKSKVRNEATGSTMTEEYTSASRIEKERTLDLNENGSTMRSDVEFEGVGHIGVLKKQNPDDHPEVKPLFESSEDYVGSFKIQQYADEYGTSVASNKSTTGYGYVAVDKRVRNSQRTYESGTGFYKSEEFIETPTSYMAKNLSLTHAPTSFVYSPNFQANQSIKWSEGMWSKSSDLVSGANIANGESPYRSVPSSCLANSSARPGTLISERYSYLDSLQKETVAYGLNEMKTEVSFSGQADYRVIHRGENDTDIVDNEERYVGSYDIKRHVHLSGVSKYDRPHLTVIKEGTTRTEWLNGTDATLAEYSIRITNDGDRALAPIQVRDIFPPGTQYVRSTIRPAKLEPAFADWTLAHLGIGDTIVIGLTLNVTEIAQGNLVNRVDVCGSYSGGSVCSGNYSVQEFSWLACCPPTVHLSKKAWLDESDPTIVHYRIVVANRADDSVAVTVTDQLPASMTLLDASIEPNTNAGSQIIWALTDIPAGKSRSIDYTARASRDGGFTNIVHIDAVAINGDSSDTAEAAAYIEINATGAAPRTFMYGGWEPPAWNLTSPDSVLTMEPELEVLIESPED